MPNSWAKFLDAKSVLFIQILWQGPEIIFPQTSQVVLK